MTARPLHSRRPALASGGTVVTTIHGLDGEPSAFGFARRPDVTADLADPVGRRPGRRWRGQISSVFNFISIMIVVPCVSRTTYSRHRHATKKLRNLVARPAHASHVPARRAGWRVAESRATIEAPAFSSSERS